MNRLERLIIMADEINKGRCPTIEHFCQQFEVSERTAYDDIKALKDQLGLDIEFDRFKNGYVNLSPEKSLPEFDLTAGEVFALTLGKEMLSQYTGTSFESILQNAIEKICERLPSKVKVDSADVRSMVKFNPGGIIPISHKMFLDLNKACEKQISVDITHFAARRGETTERKIDPYRLLQNRGAWYVAAYCHLRQDFRLFALHRIHKWSLRNEYFSVAENFDIDNWVSSAFLLEHGDSEQEIAISFAPLAARYIRERQWHPLQKLQEHEDGSCTLTFMTKNLDEIKRWVLTYGSDAEVLSPQVLRGMVNQECEKLITKYSGSTNLK